MQQLRFPIAVALTSLGLVALLAVAGGLLVSTVLARGPWAGGAFGPWSHAGAGGHGSWGGAGLPAQLSGLRDVPAAERFDHFKGVQVNLADKDGQPLVVTLTPGTATATSATSLTVAANDGASRTFALDAQTAIRGSHAQGGISSPPTRCEEPCSRSISGRGRRTARRSASLRLPAPNRRRGCCAA